LRVSQQVFFNTIKKWGESMSKEFYKKAFLNKNPKPFLAFKKIYGRFFEFQRVPEALHGPCSRKWCPLMCQWRMGLTDSREGAARACLNGVLAQGDMKRFLWFFLALCFPVFWQRRLDASKNTGQPERRKSKSLWRVCLPSRAFRLHRTTSQLRQ
jgi:hypothetical protein